jgi:hypothetical protein
MPFGLQRGSCEGHPAEARNASLADPDFRSADRRLPRGGYGHKIAACDGRPIQHSVFFIDCNRIIHYVSYNYHPLCP